jgi:hypothetical protein
MNKSLILGSALALLSLASLSGCALRDTQMFHDDTAKLFDAKQGDMKACYDGVLKTAPTAAGKVTVNFKWEPGTGKLLGTAVDKANTTAPEPVQQCVTHALDGLVINPADKKEGQGTWTFEFAAGTPKA